MEYYILVKEARSWHHNHRRLVCSCGHVDLVAAEAVRRSCSMGLALKHNLSLTAPGESSLLCYCRYRGYTMFRHSECFAVRSMGRVECTQKVGVREM